MADRIRPDNKMKNFEKFKVGLCFNLKGSAGNDDSDEEYDDPETIDFLSSQLESFGFEVIRFEQNSGTFERLRSERPGWVLNIAEGKGNSRSRESQIPSLLEWLNIPYYGSDPISLGITLDKALTNKLLKASGIPVPEMVVINDVRDLKDRIPDFNEKIHIVKPRWEGSSKGIFLSSIVKNAGDCGKQVRRVLDEYDQPALIEEYISGDEITVAVTGNEDPAVFGMMKISERHPVSDHFVYSLENKRDFREKIKYERVSDILSESMIDRLALSAVNAFKCLELRDIARIDFRIDPTGIPRIIDINPLPGLSPEYSDLMLMTELRGKDYPEAVRRIMSISLARYGIAGVSENELYRCCQ